jgi:very-short-patch-repair endonuclease
MNPLPFRGEEEPRSGEGEGMRDPVLIERAKQMRRELTPAERKLWYALRAKRFNGAKFRRQVVIGSYIADFACRIPRMIIVEVDGNSHVNQREYDFRRDKELRNRGYDILRFSHGDVHANLDGVLTIIGAALDGPLSPALSPEGERGKWY